MSSKHISRLERHCASQDMYDDGGYCDTKIKRCRSYYTRFLEDGADTHCPECALQLVLAAIEAGDKFEYKDCWQEDFERMKGAEMSDELNNYPGLKALVKATELSAGTLLSSSLLQAFVHQLGVQGISLDRRGRAEVLSFRPYWTLYDSKHLADLLSARESGAKAVLRSELICEFEKQGLSTEDSFRVTEMFLEMVEKGELK